MLLSQITIVSLAICDITHAQHVTIISTERLLVGICYSKVRNSPSLATYPAMGFTGSNLPSLAEFESTVTRLKVHRMKTAAQILFGTVSAAFPARLLVENPETWPATPTTAQMKTLTS